MPFDFTAAVKADNAETPTFLWDDRVWGLWLRCPVQLKHFETKYPSTIP